MICLVIVAITVSLNIVVTEVFASSKPFTVQHFTDQLGDLELLDKTDDPNCTETNLRIPDIIGVSYSSDGKILNNTIWLSQPFIDPTRTNLTIYKVDVTNVTQTTSFKDPHVSFKNKMPIPQNVQKGIPDNDISINSPIRNYTSKEGSLMIVEKQYPIYYIATFDTDTRFFDKYWPTARTIFDSFFKLVSFQNKGTGPSNTSDINIHDIDYLPDWHVSNRNSTAIVKFLPNDPLWLRVRYEMTIQVISSPAFGKYDSDYKTALELQARHTNKWHSVLEEMSGSGAQIKQQNKVVVDRVVNTPDFSNTVGGGSHVDLTLNLNSVGSPDTYAVFTNAYSEFSRPIYRGGQPIACSLIDNTNWVPFPPPKIDLLVSPSTLTLSPGEEKDVQVRANSSASVPADVTFLSTSNSTLSLNYTPPKLFLSPFGKASTTLRVSAPDNLSRDVNSGKEIALPIIGYVGFPIGFTVSSTGHAYKSTQFEKINTTAYDYVTLLTERERSMKQFTETYDLASSSIKEFSGIVAAIVAILSPLSVLLGRKYIAKKHLTEDKVSADRSGYYAALIAALIGIAGILHLIAVPIMLGFNFTIAVFFLFFGIFQLVWVVPMIKGWRLFYYLGVIVTLIFVVIEIIGGPIAKISIAIQIFQLYYVILTVIVLINDRLESRSEPNRAFKQSNKLLRRENHQVS